MKTNLLFSATGGRVLATALLAGFMSLTAYAQTTPPPGKQQLPSTPTPDATPTERRPVIIQPDTATTRPAKSAAQQPEKAVVEEEEKEQLRFRDRLMYGGNAGLLFGDYTLIQAMPIVGYKFTEKFVAGPGLIYQYEGFRNYGGFHSFGGKVFGRAMVYDDFFLHSEYEVINMPTFRQIAGTDKFDVVRRNVSSLLGGAGYRFRIGNRSSLDFMALYNFLDSDLSPYSSPLIIRAGFSGGW